MESVQWILVAIPFLCLLIAIFCLGFVIGTSRAIDSFLDAHK